MNTDGGKPGDGSNCQKLLSYTSNGTTTDTVLAMLHIVQLPAQNVPQLFALVTSESPFQPALATVPASLAATVTIDLPVATGTQYVGPEYIGLAIDAAQHVWVYLEPDLDLPSTGPAYVTGPLVVYDNSGALLFTLQPGTGGLHLPVQLASDTSGNMWALNSNLTLSKFDTNGNALSPPGGFPTTAIIPAGASITPSSSYMSIDPSGNVWVISTGTTSNCFVEFNNAGMVITPGGNFCSAAGNLGTIATATDGSGNAWFMGTNSISKASSSGSFVTSGVSSNGCFKEIPGNTVATSENLIYDRVNDQFWGLGGYTVGVLQANGAQVFCDSNGANLPTLSLFATAQGGGYVALASGAVDGAGTLWFTSFGDVITNSALGVMSTTYYGGLNALSSTGSLSTPFDANAGTYGISIGPGLYPGPADATSQQVAVDASGNIWLVVVSIPGGVPQLVKLSGLAAPKTYQ